MILLIHSYPKGSETLKRHWPYFMNSGADEIWVIGTTEGECWAPEGIPLVRVGEDRYIDGPHLPNRLIDTLEWGACTEHEHILIAEYDVLFLSPIKVKMMEHAVAAHRAGSQTWGSTAKSFYHPPWLFKREFAKRFIEEGRKVIAEGIPDRKRGQPPPPEASPDVFFGLVVERLGQPVQIDLWTEYSRNGFDVPGHLGEAREARRNGVVVIHGIKSKMEMDFIFS